MNVVHWKDEREQEIKKKEVETRVDIDTSAMVETSKEEDPVGTEKTVMEVELQKDC